MVKRGEITLDDIQLDDVDDEERSFSDILSEYGLTDPSDLLIKVYRYGTNKHNLSKQPYLCELSTDELDSAEDILMNRYGTGVYSLRFHVYDEEKQRKVLRGVHKLSVECPPGTDPQQAKPTQNNEHLTFFQEIQAQNTANMFKVLEMQQAGLKAIADSLADNKTNAQPPMSPAELVNLMIQVKELTNHKEESVNPMKMFREVFDMHKLAKETLIEDVAPKSDLGEAVSALKVLGDLAQAKKSEAPPQGALPQPVEAPKPDTQPPQQPASDPQMIEKIKLFQQLKALVAFLVAQASKGKDPEFYGEYVLDQLPDEHLDTVFNLAMAEDRLEQLSKIDNTVKNYEPWFNTLLDYICGELAPDDSENANNPDRDGAGEHPTNIADNAQDGAREPDTLPHSAEST